MTKIKEQINTCVITEIKGGLGNQMFQYAAGFYLSKKYKKKLILDISAYNESLQQTRKYELKYFNITGGIINQKEALNYLNPREKILNKIINTIKIKGVIAKKILIILQILNDKIKKRIKEKDFFNKPDNNKIIYLNGTFFGDIYFKKYQKNILEQFTLKNEYTTSKLKKEIDDINKVNSVSIHIRRGDYIKNKNKKIYNILPIEYYRKAIKIITQNTKNPIFFVFSDDIDWCKCNLKKISRDLIFIKKQDSYKDIELMKNCKHNIIANSSFSWWGAYLNQNKDKIVICPKKYYKSENKNTKDFMPSNWIKI